MVTKATFHFCCLIDQLFFGKAIPFALFVSVVKTFFQASDNCQFAKKNLLPPSVIFWIGTYTPVCWLVLMYLL